MPFVTDGHGLLLPTAVLHSQLFAVFAAFVAINTVMYAALALAKVLPKVYVSDLWTSPNRRGQDRSIYVGGPVTLPPAVTEPHRVAQAPQLELAGNRRSSDDS